MTFNQLPEFVVGFTDPPHPRRISKLSRKYWCNKHRLKQESMPVIPVNRNHPAASAARKRTPSAAVRESPPRAAKAKKNNALMHGASASAPRFHDVASVAAVSVAMDAGNVAGVTAAHAVSAAALAAAAGSVAAPVCSVNSSYSSDSDDLDMIGGDCANLGHQSTGLSDFIDSPPGSPGRDDYDFAADGDDVDDDMPTDH